MLVSPSRFVHALKQQFLDPGRSVHAVTTSIGAAMRSNQSFLGVVCMIRLISKTLCMVRSVSKYSLTGNNLTCQ